MTVEQDIVLIRRALNQPYDIRGDGSIDRLTVAAAQEALRRLLDAHQVEITRLRRQLVSQGDDWNEEVAMLGQSIMRDQAEITRLRLKLTEAGVTEDA